METLQEIITENLSLAAKRALSVMRYKKGLARADIQAVLGLSQAFVSKWNLEYNQGDSAVFLPKCKGKPAYLSDEEKEERITYYIGKKIV